MSTIIGYVKNAGMMFALKDDAIWQRFPLLVVKCSIL